MLSVGGLFSGIGGWELGLERAGMRTLWHCEADPFARAVLEHRWPGVPCYTDVRELRAVDVAPVDVLCGGFPCQDLSVAGKGAGINGARSGLWSHFARLVGELRPRYVLVENVPALRSRGLEVVLSDLAACGYDAEWDGIPARAVGAPHQRDRIWLVAYPQREQLREQPGRGRGPGWPGAPLAAVDGSARPVADADQERRDGGTGELGPRRRAEPEDRGAKPGGAWPAEPAVGRVAHGVPHRSHRIAALGNALVPQIAEWIGRRILDYEAEREQLAA